MVAVIKSSPISVNSIPRCSYIVFLPRSLAAPAVTCIFHMFIIRPHILIRIKEKTILRDYSSGSDTPTVFSADILLTGTALAKNGQNPYRFMMTQRRTTYYVAKKENNTSIHYVILWYYHC